MTLNSFLACRHTVVITGLLFLICACADSNGSEAPASSSEPGGTAQDEQPIGAVGNDAGAATSDGLWVPEDPALSGHLTYVMTTFTYTREGIVSIDIANPVIRRVANGTHPTAQAGVTAFLQTCGGSVLEHEVAIVGEDMLPRGVTPCSADVEAFDSFDIVYNFNYHDVALSFSGEYIAAQVRYDNRHWHVKSVVYNLDGEVLGILEGTHPTWTPDGRVLTVVENEGLWLSNADFSSSERIDGGQLTGIVGRPAINPTGDQVVFEYQRKLWSMKLDGAELELLAQDSERLTSPAFSPDGEWIVFLRTYGNDYYAGGRDFYFLELATGMIVRMDADFVYGSDPAKGALRGAEAPLSWTE